MRIVPWLPAMVVVILVAAGCSQPRADRDSGAPDWYDLGGNRSEDDSGDSGGEDTDVVPVRDEDGDGFLVEEGDCDDQDAAINPAAVEICDGLDNNCDGQIDEGAVTTFYADEDGDGFGNPSASKEACEQPNGYVANGIDCNDGDADMYPGNIESCDSIDNDCDSEVDEGC